MLQNSYRGYWTNVSCIWSGNIYYDSDLNSWENVFRWIYTKQCLFWPTMGKRFWDPDCRKKTILTIPKQIYIDLGDECFKSVIIVSISKVWRQELFPMPLKWRGSGSHLNSVIIKLCVLGQLVWLSGHHCSLLWSGLFDEAFWASFNMGIPWCFRTLSNI